MDICESNQEFETPRPPLVPPEKNNGTTRRSRTREVSSRYKSPTPRRCPSPTITRTGAARSLPVPKRAISAERKRPSTPPSPPSPSTPVHDTNVDIHLAARKVAGNRLPEGLWPSRTRSLSVSFQSDTFSLPISKREKPVTQVLSDRTLKPSSNVAHQKTVTPPISRKPTPERKRSPLKGKNAIDQSENSKPVDVLHSRLVEQHQWPSRTGAKAPSNALNKSIDLTDKTNRTPNPGIGMPSLRRMSIPDQMSRPLQKSASDALRLVSSLLESERLEFDHPQRISKLISSNSSEKSTLTTPAVRSQSLPSLGSRPPSPNTASVRGISPSRTRSLNPAPSRGVSPSRIRSSSPSRQSNNVNATSVLSFIADIKKGKKANYIDDAHHLRLLYNRHLQWRFANAQAESVLYSQKVSAEKTLYDVWRTTSELRDSVTEKRIGLKQLRLKMKLYSVLNEQMTYLNEWATGERDHTSALSGAIEDLQANTLRLPLTVGAKADIETLSMAVCSAVQVMQTIGSSLSSTLSRVEGMNVLVSELAVVAAEERAMLDECESLLTSAEALQVEEYSLRTNLIQLTQAWKSGE